MKPNHIDGWLYVGLGICAAVIAILDTTDAGKYIPQPTLFYIKFYAAVLNAAFLAGKMYRSTNFAQAIDSDKAADRLAIPDTDRTNEAPGTAPAPERSGDGPSPATKITMLLLLCVLGGLGVSQTGCTAVPTDMFPKFTWYWSADAKAYRLRQEQAANSYQAYLTAHQTNNLAQSSQSTAATIIYRDCDANH